MNIKFSKGYMMSGRDFKLTDSITLHHPDMNEIYNINHGFMSEQLYWSYVSSLMCDPYTHMVMLDDMGKRFMDTTPFEVLIILLKNQGQEDVDAYLEMINKALELFIVEKHDFALSQYNDGQYCLYDVNNPSCQIDEKVFNCIYEWLITTNKIDSSKKLNIKDDNSYMVLIDDARRELKKAKRNKGKKKKDEDKEFFGSLMSSICFGGNGAATPFNIMDYKIYWLLENQSVIARKQHSDNLYRGIYGGTISSKDIKKEELDWMN